MSPKDNNENQISDTTSNGSETNETTTHLYYLGTRRPHNPTTDQDFAEIKHHVDTSHVVPNLPTGIEGVAMGDSHAEMSQAGVEAAKQNIGEAQEAIAAITNQLDEVITGLGVLDDKYDDAIGSLAAAAGGSMQMYVTDAMAILQVCKEEIGTRAQSARLVKEGLEGDYNKLSYANEQLDQTQF